MLKESRKFDLFVGVKMGSKRFNTPTSLARSLAHDMAYRIVRNHAVRHGISITWPNRNRVYNKVYNRLLPRCKWIMQRK